MTLRELSRDLVGICEHCSALAWRIRTLRLEVRGGIWLRVVERTECDCAPGEPEPVLP